MNGADHDIFYHALYIWMYADSLWRNFYRLYMYTRQMFITALSVSFVFVCYHFHVNISVDTKPWVNSWKDSGTLVERWSVKQESRRLMIAFCGGMRPFLLGLIS